MAHHRCQPPSAAVPVEEEERLGLNKADEFDREVIVAKSQ
jgi:hypothetical protein